MLYKDGKFQFARLESLLRQAVKSPPRAKIVDSGTRPNRKIMPGAQLCLPGRNYVCLAAIVHSAGCRVHMQL